MNFLQTGFQLFNMLNAAHSSEERSSSYMAYLWPINRLLWPINRLIMAIYAYKRHIFAHKWPTNGLLMCKNGQNMAY